MQRQFPLALDVGCGRGHIARHMDSDIIKTLVQCDYAELPLVSVPVYSTVNSCSSLCHIVTEFCSS